MAEHSNRNNEKQDGTSGAASAGGQDQSSCGRPWSLHPNNADQPSLKLILNASTSSLHKLPSYEDALKSSSEETSDGRIISTCLNTGNHSNKPSLLERSCSTTP